MKQEIIVKVNSKLPLNKLNGNHVLVWDCTKHEYYATTVAEFLAPQNLRIEALQKNFVELQTKFEELTKKCENEQKAFLEEFAKEKNTFMAQYKETNSKIIEMVKSFTGEGD